jgi:hypothetical protein
LDFILVRSEDASWVPEHRDEGAEQMAALRVEIASKSSTIAGWAANPAALAIKEVADQMVALASDRDRLTGELAELERGAKVAEARAQVDAVAAVKAYIAKMRALPAGDERTQIRTRIASHLRKLVVGAATAGRALRFQFDGALGGFLWDWERG